MWEWLAIPVEFTRGWAIFIITIWLFIGIAVEKKK